MGNKSYLPSTCCWSHDAARDKQTFDHKRGEGERQQTDEEDEVHVSTGPVVRSKETGGERQDGHDVGRHGVPTNRKHRSDRNFKVDNSACSFKLI